MAHEREDRREAAQPVVSGYPPHEPPGEGDDLGMAGQGETEAVEDGATSSGATAQDPEWAPVQAGSSSRPSRMLFSTAGSMSRRQRA
jgi:hypothetical protein